MGQIQRRGWRGRERTMQSNRWRHTAYEEDMKHMNGKGVILIRRMRRDQKDRERVTRSG